MVLRETFKHVIVHEAVWREITSDAVGTAELLREKAGLWVSQELLNLLPKS